MNKTYTVKQCGKIITVKYPVKDGDEPIICDECSRRKKWVK